MLYIESVKFNIANKKCDSYPYNIPVLLKNRKIEFTNSVTFIVGENGSGKSTLIEAIAKAYGFNSEGGSTNFSFETYDSTSELSSCTTLTKGLFKPKDNYFLRAESFYNVISNIDEMDNIQAPTKKINAFYGGKSLHLYSHGESFITLFNKRFKGNGLYILDEPEAALSAERQYSLLYQIYNLVEKQSQFIIATHSPILLAYPNASILAIDNCGELRQISYEDSDQYKFMNMFINNYSYMVNKLLKS